jgi:RHS repeat-associated protein
MKSQAKALFIAFSFVWVACQQAPSSGPLRRLQPAAVQSAALPGALALVDRDTTTGTLVQGRVEVKVSFPRDFDTALVKVFADGPIDVSLGEQQVRAEPGQWSRLSLETPHRGRQVTLVLEAAGARLTELELWGTGHRSAPRDPQLLAALSERVEDGAFDDLRIFRASPASRKLTPVGLGHGTACTQVELRAPTADVDLPAVARAFLVYEAVGVPRSISLRRSINGAEPVGGLWLPGGNAERTLVDELNPRELSSQSLVTLCLPNSAERPVSIRNLRVVALLDDGALTFDRNVASVLQEAVDGSARTAQLLPAGTYSVGLSRTVAIDELTAEVSLVPAAASGRFFAGGQPLELGALPLVRGTNAIAPPALPVEGFELTLAGPARADIPAAELSELTLVGSPVGRRMSSSALVVSYPQLRLRDGKLRGERFGATGYVAGWAESPAGPGVVEIDGAIVSGPDGQFSTQIHRSIASGTSWKVTVVARFPDGTRTTRELHLDDDRESELLAAQGAEVLAQDEARRYGREDETAWGRVRKEGGTVTLGSDVLFEAPVGAVEGDVSVGIQRKGRESIPPLDPGMINVTAPTGGAYRFHPPGQVFKVPVAITLPYDPLLLPEGTPDEEIRTYYYDKKESRWVVLERKSVRRDTRQIVSETTHFTFMVNAVLVTPEHPGPVSFDPNSIKDIATADPAAGIDFIEPPIGGWDGNARVTFPLRLPKARGGYQPQLALSYDSSAGNGWLGMGWNLAVPSVGIDTRFGAARYDGHDRYTYAGEQLIPGGSSASGCLVGGNGRRYYPRVEGAFSRILRCGAGPGSYHFEITEKDGTLFVFGASDDARVRKAGGPIGEWLLERVVDANGNLTVFRYAPDYNGAPATHPLPGHKEPFTHQYLEAIVYTGRTERTTASAVTGAGDTAGAFSIAFHREADPEAASKYLDRQDVIVNGRLGFKTLLRHRLGRISVTYGADVIREYSLHYTGGDFGKSLLQKLQVYGRGGVNGGALFYEHSFGYTRKQDDEGAIRSLADFPIASIEGADDRAAMTHSKSSGAGANAYFGIGPTPVKEGGSVGVRFGYNHREGSTRALLTDVNGDGRADRLWGDGRVSFNQGRNATMTNTGPSGDPAVNQTLRVALDDLGSMSSDSFDLSVEGTIPGGVLLSFGKNFALSRTRSALMDADGDGLIDFVTPSGVQFQQPRTSASDFIEFIASKPLAPAGGSEEALANDPDLQQRRKEVQDASRPMAPLIEWNAPYAGVVDIAGVLQYAQGFEARPGADGVKLTLYKNSSWIADWSKAATDLGPTQVSRTGIAVAFGDRLYFVLSTLDDVPIRKEEGRPVAVEAVRFRPRIDYRSCSGGCGALTAADPTTTDPTGRKLFRFDLAEDFRLAGHPFGVVRSSDTGTLRLSGSLQKTPSSDDLRVCVLKFAAANYPTGNERCVPPPAGGAVPGQVYFHAFTSGETRTRTEAGFDVPVTAGEWLLFLVDSELAYDPKSLDWRFHGEMTSLCGVSGGSCRATTPEERERLWIVPDPFFRLHGQLSDRPLRPFIAPRAGEITLSSSAFNTSNLPLPPITFSVRTPSGVLVKHGMNSSGSVTLRVNGGEAFWVEAHSEDLVAQQYLWNTTYRYTGEVGQGGVPVTYAITPRHITTDRAGEVPGYISAEVSPFAGGFQRFRFGYWAGRSTEPFDSDLFLPVDEDQLGDWYHEEDEEKKNRKARDRFRDPNSYERRRAERVGMMFSRWQGTRTPDDEGLHPAPAFVSADALVFIGQDGSMHAARRGARAVAGAATAQVDLQLGLGGTVQESSSETWHGGLSASLPGQSASLSVSGGTTFQQIDLMDVNGDGVLDMLRGAGNGTATGHVTPLAPGFAPLTVPMPGGTRLQQDLNATVGMGVYAEKRGKPSNLGEAIAAAITSGGIGLGVGMSATASGLVDINADGLPDAVRWDGDKMKVRLNYGTSMATQEDTVPVGTWASTHVLQKLTDKIVGASWGEEPDEDPERAKSRNSIGQALGLIVSPNVIDRSNTLTLEGNIGFATPAESFGASASIDTTFTETPVSLIDVTGDGLPDYVRKARGDTALQVMVNNGFGFDAPQQWTMPSWLPSLLPGFDFPSEYAGLGFVGGASDVLKDIVGEDGIFTAVDTVESHGSHTLIPNLGLQALFGPCVFPGICFHIGVGVNATFEQVSGFELGFSDIDGDGFADHVLKSHHLSGVTKVIARMNDGAGGNLLATIRRPLGGTVTLGYTTAGNTVDLPSQRFVLEKVKVESGYKSGIGRDFTTHFSYSGGLYDRAEREFFGFRKVVRTNPDGSTITQLFHQGSYETRGNIESEVLKDPGGKLFTATFTHYAGRQTVGSGDPTCVSRTPFFLHPSRYCASFFTGVREVETRFYESKTTELSQAGIITRQRYQYDGVGNVKVFEDLGQDDDPDDDFHAEMQYANDDAALGIYSIDRAEHMWVRADEFGGGGALLRERWATFDTAGNTRTLTERIDSSRTATTTLTWEDGLLKSFVGPVSAANDQYSIHYDEYDATRTFPRVIRDAFGHTSLSEYDPGLGAPTLTRDIAGNTTEWRYDEFGRAQKVFGPKDTGPDATPLIEFSYHHQVTAAMPLAWSKTSHKLPRTFVPTDGSLDTLMFVDGLRRVIQVQKDATVEGQRPGRTASGSVAFNAMGKLERQGQPCFRALGTPFEECPELHPTVQEYDVVGRITQATAPTNRITRSVYDLAAPGGVGPKRWRVTVTDPLVQKRVMFRDASERVVAIEDHLNGRTPRTTYEFSRLGELEKIKDAANNETTLGYDMLGRRTSVDNRDTGKTEFRYDAAGNLTDRITANLRLRNQSIHYVYKLNRLERVEYPDSTPIRFFYGTSGNDTNRIVRIEDEAGAEEKHYGALGETIEMTRTVRALKPGDSPLSLVTRFSFDEFGRSLTVQYPDGELLSYGYDEGGLLRAARGQRPAMGRRPAETETYLEKLGYDVFGQRVALQLGNGVQTRFTYEPDTRRLKTIQTGTSHGRTLQALTYTYDDADNITDVVNALGAATPQRAGGVRFKYTYDELYRLTSAEGWAAARPGVTDHFFSEFQYSDIHNLDRKTQKRELIKTLSLDQTVERPDHANHDWAYAYGGRGPHQAVRIGETALSYDLNGNQVVECRSPSGEVCVGTPEASEPNAIISHDHLRRYAWNEENWLKSVTIGGGQNVTRFLYDGRGERVVKQGHSGTTINAGQFYSLKNKVYGTKHIFAGNTRLVSKLQPLPPSGGGDPTDTDPPPLEDREPNDNGCEPSGDKPRKCTLPIGGGNGSGGAYSNFRPVSYYFHSDHLGSSTVLTDQFARVQERVEYYPFGELWREDREERVGNLRRTQQFLFTSKPFDEETGLTYFGARYFDSRRVRWLSTDPDWMSQGVIGLNVYQYVDWDPIGNVDPDGRGLLRIGFKLSKALFKKVVKGADKVDEFVDLYESWTVLTTPSAGFGAHLGASLSIASEILPVSVGDAKDVYRWGKRLFEGGKEIAQKADNVPVNRIDDVARQVDEGPDWKVGPHGDMPSPRPKGYESHHGVNSVWAKANVPGYDPSKAPAILMQNDPFHNATRGIFNQIRKEIAQRQGVSPRDIDWKKVSPGTAWRIAEEQFEAAQVPAHVRELYFKHFNDYLNAAK